MVRHGIRGPLIYFPNETNLEYWQKYENDILPAGLKDLYNYGEFTMKKYADFLNPVYRSDRVYARSSDLDRAINSASAFLAGVFKPSHHQEWTSQKGLTGYLPIPIHVDGLDVDEVF